MKFSIALLTLFVVGGLSITAFGHGGTHPDIELELEGTSPTQELHIHGATLVHNHDFFEFVDVSGQWRTRHATGTPPTDEDWPGIASDGGFTSGDAGEELDFVSLSALYYWDASGSVGSSNFVAVPVTSNTQIAITDAGGFDTINVDSTTTSKTLDSVATVGATGDFHTHPIWILSDGVSTPTDGAYFFEFRIEHQAGVWDPTDTAGVLFHKGLNDSQYENAAESAASQFGLSIPEPASLILLGLGASAVVLRRQR